MNGNQIIIALYAYLLHQDSRLETQYTNAAKFSFGSRVSSIQIMSYWIAKLKYEHFREFSNAITEILSFYEIDS